MGVKGSGRKPQTTEWFIGRVIEVHGEGKFGFDRCEYKGNRKTVDLYCFECEDYFESRAASILIGGGCNLCRRKRTAIKKTLTTEQFIERAVLVHGDRYSYSDSVYVATNKNVKISCEIHGTFLQQPSNHLQGQGCPKCNHWDILAKNRPDHPATLYHVKFTDRRDGAVFHKIGITIKKWSDRFTGCKKMGYDLELLESYQGRCQDCHNKEIDILNYLDVSGNRYKCRELKGTHVGGWTETYWPSEDVVKRISEIINS